VTDRRFTRFAIAVLAYNVAVVLFGAVVRATGSGAGCGANWPSCQGSFVPEGTDAATLIEFTHRATSGVALALVAIMVVWAVRSRPRGDIVRWMAIASGILIVNEALIGAMLVLFEWVADDESVGRVFSVVLHLVNTFLLLGALTLTAWFSTGKPVPRRRFPEHSWRLLRWGVILLIVVSAMGAITALGDTLFPKESLGAGFFDDLAGTLIRRLRWIHPVLAVGTAGYLLWMLRRLESSAMWAVTVGDGGQVSRVAVTGRSTSAGAALERLVYLQLALGMTNVVLLAPVWMQVVHLLVADLLWISFVLYASQTMAMQQQVPK
jgi:heme A synthase